MPKIIIYLNELEYKALYQLSLSEYRDIRAESAIIIRRELEQRGFIEQEETEGDDNADESGN